MRTFYLWRETDDSGVSGTGKVAEGVEFTGGMCVLHWLVPQPTTMSLEVLEDIEHVKRIHGHGGHTKIAFEGENMG
jgi:hypothetical protein